MDKEIISKLLFGAKKEWEQTINEWNEKPGSEKFLENLRIFTTYIEEINWHIEH